MAFHVSNFFTDPFAISTVSFGAIAWIVAIAGAATSPAKEFPRFTWWGLVYEILLILAILLLYINNTIELYKFTLVGLLSIAFLYTSNSTSQLIYQSDSSAMLCCAAGCILLSMLNFIWILYFGGHPESPTNQFIDSFSLKSQSHSHGHLSSGDGNRRSSRRVTGVSGGAHDDDEEYKYISPVALPNASAHNQFQENNLRQSQLTTNNKSTTTPYMSSSQLNGLENFSTSDVHKSRDLTNNRQTIYNDVQSQGEIPGVTFRYKARALYSYEANPDDINEISFVKDEVLEVDDIDGKWWQARRANGQVGICPSNYVKLLE
ncbi:high osmolarity signaling protein Sho1p [[Candida] anglica]|uniref:High osmolarity signaling protein SHO1 n=1 Tax=[Candida] anglica TaxID=148631 RepID=A0ABP0EHD6_9ASCO